MKFGLRNGPWKTVFQGDFQGHDVEILSNPEQVMLVAIYEKDGQEVTGVVLQAFSVFSAVGEAETFIESLEREAVLLSRHDGKHTVQFLSLASRPVYAKASDEEVAKTVDGLISGLIQAVSKTGAVAKSFDLHLTPLAKCSGALKQAFFSQPAVIPMLVREKKRIEFEKEEQAVETGAEGGAVLLGVTKEGKAIKEPLQLFQKSLVTDGSFSERVHFAQILAESFLLANVPVVVFDSKSIFFGLSHPNSNRAELESYGVDIDPIGFPVKGFEPRKNISVNINLVPPAGLLELFGCRDKETEDLVSKGLALGEVNSPDELIANIEKIPGKDFENPFLKKRVQRIVKLFEVVYPEFFGGKTDVEDIAKTWFKKIGRATIINVEKLDPRALTFLVESLSRELLKLFQKQGETSKPKLLLAMPDFGALFDLKENLLQKDLVRVFKEMSSFGVYFVVGAERRSDLPKELVQIVETKAGVIKGNDFALDLPNSKNYRLLLRPTLSQGVS
jgi:hypothetical protein